MTCPTLTSTAPELRVRAIIAVGAAASHCVAMIGGGFAAHAFVHSIRVSMLQRIARAHGVALNDDDASARAAVVSEWPAPAGIETLAIGALSHRDLCEGSVSDASS